MGGSLVGNDLNLTTLDLGFSFMDAMRGFAALVEQRNATMSDFADVSAAGETDAALSMINASQLARRAMLTAGAVTVGLQLAKLGFAAGRSATGRSFGSFAALKSYLGSPGAGNVWHHIVEQSKTSKFGVALIQNVNNVVALPSLLNIKLNALYSSKRPDITGSNLTLREWLNGKSFQFNRDFGIQAIINVRSGAW